VLEVPRPAAALVLLTLIAPPAAAQDAAALRARGLQLGFNLDHAEALAAFQQAAAADPQDAAAFRLAAATAWTEQLFDHGAITVDDYLGEARATVPRGATDPRLASTIRGALDTAIALGERRVRERPSDADAHFQLGAAYGVLASYTATVEGRVLGSLGPARRAYREHERVLQLDPKRKDAGLIVGTYRYAVSSLSLPLRIAAHIAGFGGNRTMGVRMIEDAANDPAADSQANALFVLVLVYNRESRFDDALRVVERLQRQFPRNRLLWLEAASTALRADRARLALTLVEQGLARQAADPRRRAPGEDARWKFVHGAALVRTGQSAAAGRELVAALAMPSRSWVRGRIHTELGKAADLDGDRLRAEAEYRSAIRLCEEDDDGEGASQARTLLKNRFRLEG
jgi:tetratricopeptide (TPR) repeat protein